MQDVSSNPALSAVRKFPLAAVVAAVLQLAACSGGSGSDAVPPSSGANTGSVSDVDKAIARAVYGISDSLPDGFFRDESPYTDRPSFVHHIKSSEAEVQPALSDYEVCSDDFAQALAWSATSAEARGYDTQLAGNSTTDWYFQFDRQINSVEPAMLINRVFRCAVLDRSSLSDDGSAGIINRSPFVQQDVSWLAEYLWQFSIYNNALHAVVESTGETTAQEFRHRIQRAEALRFAGDDGCDIIEVWSIDYVGDRASGALRVSETFVRMFQARFENGQALLCGS